MRRHVSHFMVKRYAARTVAKPKADRPIIQKQRQRNLDLDTKAEEKGLSWRYISARFADVTCSIICTVNCLM